jgi:hypothetical protein
VNQQGNPQGAAKKRKKKKNLTAPVLGQVGVASASGQVMASQQFAPIVPAAVPQLVQPTLPVGDTPVADVAVVKPKKGGRCWKCAVNSHTSKECKVVHYCLVCDNDKHPTNRCPILKLPKPVGYFVGCGDDATLNLHLPDSVHKPHLIPTGAPTALVQVTGDTVPAAAIQSLLARMCPGHADWKWEAIAHGANAFLIGIPSTDDLSRIDGMQMGVPNFKAQIAVSTWQREDILPEFVMEPAWVHVEGVPYTIRHFHGLWALGSLIGTTLDVDLVSLRSQGVVRILIAMRDLSALEKDVSDGSVPPCLEVVALLKLNGYRLRYRRESPQYVRDPKF